MTEWSLKLQDGPAQGVTSNLVTYDDETELLSQINLPTTDSELANKEYADGNLFGYPGQPGVFTGDFPTWNTDFSNWDRSNVNDALFNALKIVNFQVAGSTPSDGQAIVFHSLDSMYYPDDIVNSITGSGVGQTLINSGPTGNVLLKDLQSSDSSVSILSNATDLDLKVPAIDLENTSDGASKYLLTNPGAATIGGDPYLFLGLNTQTPSFITFDSDASNVYINATNIVGVISKSTSTGSIGTNASETTMQSLTIPANTLTTNGQQVVFSMAGSYQSTASNLTVRFKFGSSTTIATVPTAGLIGNASSSWQATFTVTRTSTTGFAWQVKFFGSDASAIGTNQIIWVQNGVSSTWDWTVSNNIFMSAQTGAAGQITYAAGTTLILQS